MALEPLWPTERGLSGECGAVQERMIADGFTSYATDNQTTVSVETAADGRTLFRATSGGSGNAAR